MPAPWRRSLVTLSWISSLGFETLCRLHSPLTSLSLHSHVLGWVFDFFVSKGWRAPGRASVSPDLPVSLPACFASPAGMFGRGLVTLLPSPQSSLQRMRDWPRCWMPPPRNLCAFCLRFPVTPTPRPTLLPCVCEFCFCYPRGEPQAGAICLFASGLPPVPLCALWGAHSHTLIPRCSATRFSKWAETDGGTGVQEGKLGCFPVFSGSGGLSEVGAPPPLAPLPAWLKWGGAFCVFP